MKDSGSQKGKKYSIPSFSPASVVESSSSPAYNIHIIDRIRVGVSKKEWKEFIKKNRGYRKRDNEIIANFIKQHAKERGLR